MGVLASCADFEYCLEDPSSSLGGRCVPNDQEYVYAVVDSHRMLTQCSGEWTYDCIECTMSDGSAGKKCDGKLACMSGVMGGVGVGGINPNEVPCGSCNGKYACSNAVGPIGEGSCNAEGACYSHRCKFCLLTNLPKHTHHVFLIQMQLFRLCRKQFLVCI